MHVAMVPARVVIGLCLTIWAMAAQAAPAHAATLNVTKTADTADGTCNSDCSLREAIIAANATAVADTITVPADVYVLEIPGEDVDEDIAAKGDLDITSTITIKGVGGTPIVDGDGENNVIHVVSGTTTISNLHITGAESSGVLTAGIARLANSFIVANGNGAAVSTDSTGSLTITNSLVSANQRWGILTSNGGTADVTGSVVRGSEVGIVNGGTLRVSDSTIGANSGPGILNGDPFALTPGSVTVTNSRIVRNRPGIHSELGGSITLVGSTVERNEAGSRPGGGISSTSTDLSITNSTIAGNRSQSGGGIYQGVGGSATLINTRVIANRASSFGAGLYVHDATAALNNTSVSGNISEGFSSCGCGGGIFVSGETESVGTVNVTSSTLTGNQATSGAGIVIGGAGVAVVSNSTISGNNAKVEGGGILVAADGTLTLSSSTVAANRADSDANNSGQGGGLRSESGSSTSLTNSILAGNTDGPPSVFHPDCSGSGTSNGFNAIGNAAGCAVTFQSSDTVGAVALGPLANNGGPTQTHALLPGSIALNHGPASGSPGLDQRGVPRPQAEAQDTGAYEQAFCSGQLVNVVGTEAADNLVGTPLADGALALGGNDTVRLGDGNDKGCGGDGNDKLYGQNHNDTLLGEAGNDRVDGGPGDDALDGGLGADTCVGGTGRNRLISC